MEFKLIFIMIINLLQLDAVWCNLMQLSATEWHSGRYLRKTLASSDQIANNRPSKSTNDWSWPEQNWSRSNIQIPISNKYQLKNSRSSTRTICVKVRRVKWKLDESSEIIKMISKIIRTAEMIRNDQKGLEMSSWKQKWSIMIESDQIWWEMGGHDQQ
jgi:hypothetical protein